jgi:hypothetical protein
VGTFPDAGVFGGAEPRGVTWATRPVAGPRISSTTLLTENPVADLISVPRQNNFDFGVGTKDKP